jgi:hypothetical protein
MNSIENTDNIIATNSLADLDQQLILNQHMIDMTTGDMKIYYQGLDHLLSFARDFKEYLYLNNIPELPFNRNDDNFGQLIYLQNRIKELTRKKDTRSAF